MERVLAGRRALVTGGARGIGRCTAAALLAEGVHVVIADVALPVAEATAAALASDRARVEAVGLDVSDGAAFARVVADVEARLGPLDVLVNNAGIMSLGPFLGQDPRLDARQLDVNVRGVIHGMRAVLPGMVARRRGHVVNVASVAGRVGVPYAAVYAATKHAVVGLGEAVRHELADQGISITTVLPSIVDTELASGTGRLRYPPRVRPEQVADAIVGALRTGAPEVWVPRFGRLAHVLPAILPRPLVERVGRWFGIDRVFARVDDAARRDYLARLLDPTA